MEPQIHKSISEPKPLSVELLGKPIHIVRDKLENIIQDSSHCLVNELQHWLNTNQVEVVFNQVSLHTLAPLEMDKSLTSVCRHQQGGLVYVYCDTPLLIKLADRFYNADLERSKGTLTSSDLRLQERMTRHIIDWIAPGDMWRNSDFELSYGIGLKTTLDIHFGEHSGTLTMVFDSQLIQTLIDQLDLHQQDDLHDPFCHALESAPVKLNVLLSKKTLLLSDVLNLAPNDIMPIELLSTVPVSIGNERLFTGRVAEQEGQLVLILNDDKESLR